MVDEGGRAEPELRTVFAGRIHDAEIILAVAEQHVLLALRELGDASHQILDLVVSFPATPDTRISPDLPQPRRRSTQRGSAQTRTRPTGAAGGRGQNKQKQRASWSHHAFVATILAPFCSEE